MKTAKFIIWITLLFSCCYLSSCNIFDPFINGLVKLPEPKEWTALPPASQTGANTMGCLVNGNLWATGKLSLGIVQPNIFAYYKGYKDYISLNFYAENDYGGMGFTVKNPRLGLNSARVNCHFDLVPNCTVLKKRVDITIDKMDFDEGILSGHFAFDIPCSDNSEKKLKITEGRFDMYMSVSK